MGAGIRLKQVLRNKNMTIKQLSELSGVSLNTLYSITKRDSENIDPIILDRITEALSISHDDFWGYSKLRVKKIPFSSIDPALLVEQSSENQEMEAFNDYLNGLGYHAVIELSPDNPNGLWTIYDSRSDKKYTVSADTLDKLMHSINSFAKFQIVTALSNAELQESE